MTTLTYDRRQICMRPKLSDEHDTVTVHVTASRGLSASAEGITSVDDSGRAFSCLPVPLRSTKSIAFGTPHAACGAKDSDAAAPGLPSPTTTGPLAERDRVLAELAEHAGCALGGAGMLVMIRGEAGIGKSSVVRAFCHDFRGGTVAISHCDPVSAPVPLGPILDLCDCLDQDVGARLKGAISRRGGVGSCSVRCRVGPRCDRAAGLGHRERALGR